MQLLLPEQANDKKWRSGISKLCMMRYEQSTRVTMNCLVDLGSDNKSFVLLLVKAGSKTATSITCDDFLFNVQHALKEQPMKASSLSCSAVSNLTHQYAATATMGETWKGYIYYVLQFY